MAGFDPQAMEFREGRLRRVRHIENREQDELTFQVLEEDRKGVPRPIRIGGPRKSWMQTTTNYPKLGPIPGQDWRDIKRLSEDRTNKK